MKHILYGMAFQALITSALTYLGAIQPTPGQQALAGLGFLILSLAGGLTMRPADRNQHGTSGEVESGG